MYMDITGIDLFESNVGNVMCAPSSQVDTTLENVDNVITVRISRENLDSENPLLLFQTMPWRQSETMSLKYESCS